MPVSGTKLRGNSLEEDNDSLLTELQIYVSTINHKKVDNWLTEWDITEDTIEIELDLLPIHNKNKDFKENITESH